MNGRKSLFFGMLSLVPCLLAVSWAAAQEADPPPKTDPKDALGDDFRPLLPSPKPGDRGHHGKGPFDRPGAPDGFRPGEPRGGMGGPLMPGQGMMPGQPGMPAQGMMPGPPGMPGQGMMMPGPPRWPHSSWQSLEKNDPEMFKLLQADFDLDRQSQQLAVQYRQAPKDQQEAIKQKLEKVVAEHFEARQQRRLLELKRLEEELKRLRDSIDKRQEGQAQIVNRRVSELLGVQDEPQF